MNRALVIFFIVFSALGCRSRENTYAVESLSDNDEHSWQDISANEFEIDDPPKDQSSAFKKDFEILFAEQDARSEADCELANLQTDPTFEAFFNPKAKKLTTREYERVAEFMERVTKYSEKVANHFKEKFERKRPYDEDRNLKPCAAKPEGSRSYPSSHAAAAITDACILAEIFPDKAEELTKYGKHLGDLRYIVGVHHPSDVAAGQKLGHDICKRLLSDPSFLREMKAL